jgi:hypothetical protein
MLGHSPELRWISCGILSCKFGSKICKIIIRWTAIGHVIILQRLIYQSSLFPSRSSSGHIVSHCPALRFLLWRRSSTCCLSWQISACISFHQSCTRGLSCWVDLSRVQRARMLWLSSWCPSFCIFSLLSLPIYLIFQLILLLCNRVVIIRL